jgi:mono/diheme cytochrome c family protein
MMLDAWRALYVALSMSLLAACGQPEAERRLPLPPAGFVADAAQGAALFQQHCAGCHGGDLAGSRQGPPLLHAIYRADHHADLAFYLAVANGVRAHHWSFGDMPPLPSVTPTQAGHIVGFVRARQRQAGL